MEFFKDLKFILKIIKLFINLSIEMCNNIINKHFISP